CSSFITSTSPVQPFQTTWLEAERLLRLRIRGTAELRAVIDDVLADCGQRLLLRDPRRRWGTDEARKRRQPDADGRRVVVDDVGHAGRCRKDVCRGDRGILDLDPRPDGPAVSDDRNLLPAHLISACSVWVVPGAPAVEEPIPQGDAFHRLRTQHPRFELRIGPRVPSHTRAGVDRQTRGLIGQAATRLMEEATHLLDVPAASA